MISHNRINLPLISDWYDIQQYIESICRKYLPTPKPLTSFNSTPMGCCELIKLYINLYTYGKKRTHPGSLPENDHTIVLGDLADMKTAYNCP